MGTLQSLVGSQWTLICHVVLTGPGRLGFEGFFLEDKELQQPLEERTSERLKTIQGLH